MRRLLRNAAAAVAMLAMAAGAASRAEAISAIRDAEIEQTLARMSAPIFSAAGLSPDQVEIFIVNDSALNAFVVGRNMAFHSGLLIDLEDPRELLGVIAHETGHIAGGHGIQTRDALARAQRVGLLASVLGIAAAAAGGGSAGAAIAGSGQQVAQRSFLRYSRGQESAADQAAVTYLETARISPEGMLGTLKRLKAREYVTVSGRDPYAFTHPLSRERITRLEQRVAASPLRGAAVDAETLYWHNRMRAKLKGFLLPPQRTLREVADDGSEVSLIARAVAYHRTPDPNAALRAVDRLLQLRPRDPFYHELKGQILFEGGFAAQAVPVYRQAVALAPGEPLLLASLGQALLALGDPQSAREATQVLREATRRERFDASAWRLLASAEGRAGNEREAAIATAEYQLMSGSPRAAKRHAQRAQQLAPNGSPIWLRASDILAELERRENLAQ